MEKLEQQRMALSTELHVTREALQAERRHRAEAEQRRHRIEAELKVTLLILVAEAGGPPSPPPNPNLSPLTPHCPLSASGDSRESLNLCHEYVPTVCVLSVLKCNPRSIIFASVRHVASSPLFVANLCNRKIVIDAVRNSDNLVCH